MPELPDQSESRGVVVPLLAFTEHLHNRAAAHVNRAIQWKRMDPEDRLTIINLNHPDYATLFAYLEKIDIEDVIDDAIRLWAGPAYNSLLGLDRRHTTERMAALQIKLKALSPFQSYMNLMRATESDWHDVLRLWRAAGIELDAALGVDAAWGE